MTSTSQTPESAILKPKDPSLEDNNDWPAFNLTDVDVIDPQTGSLSSLLTANEGSPVIVTGKLAKRKEQAGYRAFPPCKFSPSQLHLDWCIKTVCTS